MKMNIKEFWEAIKERIDGAKKIESISIENEYTKNPIIQHTNSDRTGRIIIQIIISEKP